jgi:hypothetical protein
MLQFAGVARIMLKVLPHKGVVPAKENVCDPLKARGVTKGLYGLCVAYCEAEAHSAAVLDNFNRRRTANDPEMPCAAAPVTCPCWTQEMLAAAAGGGITPLCAFNDRDEAVYLDFSKLPFSLEAFATSATECAYIFDSDLSDINTLPGDVEARLGVTPEEEAVCRQNIADLCP